MEFEDLEIGHCYTCGDDAIYKVIEKGKDWFITLNYSCNHKVVMPWIFQSTDDIINDWYDEEDIDYTFDNLEFVDYNMLKEGE